jgi:hypothetical protein
MTTDFAEEPVMGARQLQARRSRIQVDLPGWGSPRQERELAAFARYCIARLERELGELTWVVTTAPDPTGGFSSMVTATRSEREVFVRGVGHDATLAIWDALCNIEQTLRDQLHAA